MMLLGIFFISPDLKCQETICVGNGPSVHPRYSARHPAEGGSADEWEHKLNVEWRRLIETI